ncbi:MAG: GNAT family N-acetyltransferase [Euzebya sp.]
MLRNVESDVGVRSVSTGGRRLVEVLSAAFAEDPWLRWSLPDAGAVRSLMSLFLRVVAFPHGHVLVAGDPVIGVAIVLPPGPLPPPSPEVGAMVMALHGRRRVGPALDADAIIGRYRPVADLWELHTLGVHPSVQGTGIGSALLRATLGLAAGQPVALETAADATVSWYQHRGFAVDARVDLGVGHGLDSAAPTVWLMSTRPTVQEQDAQEQVTPACFGPAAAEPPPGPGRGQR